MWIAFLLSSLLVSACNRQGRDFHDYLTKDFPSLTKGVKAAVGQTNQLLTSPQPPAGKAQQLSSEVLPGYQAVIKRLRSYEGATPAIQRTHQQYLAIAERQLEAFKQLRNAWAKGQAIEPALALLKTTHKEMLAWMGTVSSQAKEHAVELVNTQAPAQ
jgi:hypothetical protein